MSANARQSQIRSASRPAAAAPGESGPSRPSMAGRGRRLRTRAASGAAPLPCPGLPSPSSS